MSQEDPMDKKAFQERLEKLRNAAFDELRRRGISETEIAQIRAGTNPTSKRPH